MKSTILDRWLDEQILCGYPEPITRRAAMENMVADGWTREQALAALCYYRRAA